MLEMQNVDIITVSRTSTQTGVRYVTDVKIERNRNRRSIKWKTQELVKYCVM